MQYIRQRRIALGGALPMRRTETTALKTPSEELFEEFYKGTEGRSVSTTMAYVRVLSKLLRDESIGKFIVPIIPDEARTFGMEGLFRQCGIYSHVGQLYEPVDADSLMYYKEAKDGQILEEGINEAGSISSFIAAGTAAATHNINTIPFYTYYSMFGPQRVGDLVWAAGDLRCRGFLVGATSGRTTLNGEGLQHQDGHTHLLTSTVPNLISYDPAFAYEIAVIIRHGIERMYEKQESVFFYISVGNENYNMPPMPAGVKEGIIKGLYRFSQSTKTSDLKAHLIGSGAIMNQVLEAQKILEEKYHVSTDVWSAPSYNELRREALHVERENLLNGKKSKVPYVTELLRNEKGVFVSASDYMKVLGDSIRQWVPGPYTVLGTDGFGRSESREALRDFFEVDAKHIVWAALTSLHEQKQVGDELLFKAQGELKINPQKLNPMIS
jgi:pyruvate dehydrogenase E1 component